MQSDPRCTLLVVEDDAGHARLIERNLRRAGFAGAIVHLPDGRDALELLASHGVYADSAPPARPLVLLDLNMPGVDGLELLRRLGADAATRDIPTVVLTTADDAEEIRRCYELGCSAFVTKPVDYAEFSRVVGRLARFLNLLAA